MTEHWTAEDYRAAPMKPHTLRGTAAADLAVPMIDALERSLAEVKRRINAVLQLHPNVEDGTLTMFAEEAFTEGRAAFYTRATYHSALSCVLARTANAAGDVIEAMDVEYKPWNHDRREHGLDCLIPLNAAGAEALAKAYEHIGLWRAAEELEARRLRKVA